ncbi:MAG: peptide-binding protein [Desulfovibrionaceae bacterium]|nr:peptide-binding protein [Desulfovibrionaceae bacterium]
MHNFQKIISFAASVFLIFFYGWLCFSGQAHAAADKQDRPEYGGRLILGSIGEPSNLIPYLSSDAPSHEAASYLYVAPLKYDRDLNVVPWAAESYSVEQNGCKLSFKLRENIFWQDGVQLTADDVEFTYKLMIADTTPTAYAEDFLMVKEFKKTGPYSFEVYYAEPYARALSTWMGAILPRHALEGEDLLNTGFIREPLSCGTYLLSDWVPGSRLEFASNPDYFEGQPYISRIISRIIPDTSTMFLELKAGKLDMMSLSPHQYTRQTSGKKWDSDYRKYKYLAFAYTYMGYNLKNPLFADVRVRQALAHAIDKKGIVHGVLMGLGETTIGPYKPGTWAYNNEIHDYPYNPALAAELLAQAGWSQKNSDGILIKDGKPFSFTLMTNQGNEQRIKIATIIQNQLAELGIEVRIRTVEWAAFIEKFINPRNFDAIIMGWTITQDPDNYDVWHSSKYEGAGLNFIGYANPEVDKLLSEGRHLLNPEERKPIYWRIQEILHQEQPYLFLFVPYSLPIIRSDVMGVEPAPAGISYNSDRWWIKGAHKEQGDSRARMTD